MTMRTLLILASIICFSAPAFAQTAAPKVGGKPLKQVKPLAPMAASSSEQSRGPSFGPVTVRPRPNFAVQPPPLSPRRLRQHPKQIPPPLTNNKPSVEKTIADFARVVEQTGILERRLLAAHAREVT